MPRAEVRVVEANRFPAEPLGAIALNGILDAAIRIGDRYHGKNHMILFLTPP